MAAQPHQIVPPTIYLPTGADAPVSSWIPSSSVGVRPSRQVGGTPTVAKRGRVARGVCARRGPAERADLRQRASGRPHRYAVARVPITVGITVRRQLPPGSDPNDLVFTGPGGGP